MENISDSNLKYLNSMYKDPTWTLIVEETIENKNHNIMMIDITSTLNYVEFDDVKDCATTFEMWNKLKDISGRVKNVKKAKERQFCSIARTYDVISGYY